MGRDPLGTPGCPLPTKDMTLEQMAAWLIARRSNTPWSSACGQATLPCMPLIEVVQPLDAAGCPCAWCQACRQPVASAAAAVEVSRCPKSRRRRSSPREGRTRPCPKASRWPAGAPPLHAVHLLSIALLHKVQGNCVLRAGDDAPCWWCTRPAGRVRTHHPRHAGRHSPALPRHQRGQPGHGDCQPNLVRATGPRSPSQTVTPASPTAFARPVCLPRPRRPPDANPATPLGTRHGARHETPSCSSATARAGRGQTTKIHRFVAPWRTPAGWNIEVCFIGLRPLACMMKQQAGA